jgi:hypothetical protein
MEPWFLVPALDRLGIEQLQLDGEHNERSAWNVDKQLRGYRPASFSRNRNDGVYAGRCREGIYFQFLPR